MRPPAGPSGPPGRANHVTPRPALAGERRHICACGPGGAWEMMRSVDRAAITADLAARLIADQFPHWADLPLRRVEPGGWDNVTFRLEIPGIQHGARLILRCDGEGNVWASLATDA